MLVLSRRPNEKIVFPTLGITVDVRTIQRNVVRLGIDAPPSVPVLREEIAGDTMNMMPPLEPRLPHRLRNRMHTASLAIHLAQKQLQAGLEEQASVTLDGALREFAALDQELAAERTKPERKIRALLVEDNSNESTLLAEFLRLHGITVETACDGQAALEYLQSNDRPDVILLDMRMPRCDGPTMVAALRQNDAFAGLKVFAVSGADPVECSVEPGLRGVDRWFTKPVNPATLVHEMTQSLGLN